MIGWPEGSAFLVAHVGDETIDVIASAGETDQVRSWASVTKFAVAWAMAVCVDRAEVDLASPAGPVGSTVAHLLSHASGLGLEVGDPVMPVGSRRIYSNIGIDRAVAVVTGHGDPAAWLQRHVFGPLHMTTSFLDGRPAAGGWGSLRDLVTLAAGWLRADGVSTTTRDLFVAPFLADLAGVVPGFGRFDPCEWGLGPEVHGHKNHWMGSRLSARSYGHFGQSGAYVVVEPESGIVVAAAAGAPFGAWAVHLWPMWMDALHDRYVA